MGMVVINTWFDELYAQNVKHPEHEKYHVALAMVLPLLAVGPLSYLVVSVLWPKSWPFVVGYFGSLVAACYFLIAPLRKEGHFSRETLSSKWQLRNTRDVSDGAVLRLLFRDGKTTVQQMLRSIFEK